MTARLKNEAHDAARRQVWQALRPFARPDSRFHYDFAEYIPDFEGSDEATRRLLALPEFQSARLLFITPDNDLVELRRIVIERGLPFVMSTYGIGRGFLMIDPGSVPAGQEAFAATLDGMERFARPVTLDEIAELGAFDLLVTGAAVITLDGIRFGKGHGYFDLEWAMFMDSGVVDSHTPVVAVVHDCQVLDMPMTPGSHDTIVDIIITPSATRRVSSPHPKPGGVDWAILPPDMRASIPPLQQLHERALAGGR